MKAEDIILEVTRIFGDESSVQVTEEDIIRWINAAQREVVSHNVSVLETTSEIDLVAGQKEYPFPDDLLILRSLRVLTPDDRAYLFLKPKNLQEFERDILGWDGSVYGEGKPAIYTTYSNTIFLFPSPNKNVENGLKILYSKKPPDIVNITDDLSLPDTYFNSIFMFCLSRANTLDEDYEAAAIHKASFTEDLRALDNRIQSNRNDVYPSITVLPDDAW